ncbi:hypothetical protein EZV62_018683 [Acer yangbiense]|uniref:Uncharacterized protein n=1 Tax=Acer yangbiense TaxID=1000413 RepID=A0A5C7HK33_9ROSI|nr:hypothetical protein EZV62_018683 [Acer yangbiense]
MIDLPDIFSTQNGCCVQQRALELVLMTLKLRETVESGIRRTSASNGLLELPDHQNCSSSRTNSKHLLIAIL